MPSQPTGKATPPNGLDGARVGTQGTSGELYDHPVVIDREIGKHRFPCAVAEERKVEDERISRYRDVVVLPPPRNSTSASSRIGARDSDALLSAPRHHATGPCRGCGGGLAAALSARDCGPRGGRSGCVGTAAWLLLGCAGDALHSRRRCCRGVGGRLAASGSDLLEIGRTRLVWGLRACMELFPSGTTC